MRIVLFVAPGIMGPHVLLSLLARHEDKIALLVIASGRHAIGPEELIAMASKAGIAYVSPSSPKDPTFVQQVRSLQPDLILVASYDKKIPPEILEIPRIAAVNAHPSLLPKYRGACPEFWAIRNGEAETGVSLHYLTERFDAGDILLQEKIAISSHETLGALLYKLSDLTCNLFSLYLDQMKENRELPAQPQDSSAVTYAPFVTADDLCIAWEHTAVEIANLVRAVNPLAAAWTYFRGHQLRIWYAEVYEGDEPVAETAPGTLVSLSEAEKLLVQTQEGFLELGAVQFGLYGLLDGWHFALNLGVRSGEKLGKKQETSFFSKR